MTGLLQELVTVQAEARPQAPAMIAEGRTWSYGDVELLSNRLGRALRESGCERGDRVCLLSPRTPHAVMALLAIYKADGVYVPLDPQWPAARLAKIVGVCEPRCILTTSEMAPMLEQVLHDVPRSCTPLVASLDPTPLPSRRIMTRFTIDDVAHIPDRPLSYRNRAASPAHILFKSAANGTPKGVVITHANVRHFVVWANEYFGTTADDRQAGDAPLGRDLSLYDIFGTLAAGGVYLPLPDGVENVPAELAAFVAANRLTQWSSVASVLVDLAESGALQPAHVEQFQSLARVLWCGDSLPASVLRAWMQALPHIRFTNLYGPTETTIASSYYTVPEPPRDDQAPIPIGTACPGEELYVLNDRLESVPAGEVGELFVRGVGLSPGYWRDFESTHAAFLPNPDSADPSDRLFKTGDLARVAPDGLIYLEGRSSHVDRGGYRIELGEIEAALQALPSIREAAVVVVPFADGNGGGATICCAYVTATGWRVTAAGLRQQLAKLLPAYMLPSRWRALDHLPHNHDGGPDRTAVERWFAARAIAVR